MAKYEVIDGKGVIPQGATAIEEEAISRQLGTTVYFADPYSSWQKGLIENTNMLIRQYIPRNENFSKLTNEQVAAIQYKINCRPRKKIRIPNTISEIFFYLCKRELRFGLESIFL